MSRKTPKILWPALRQYRHNTDTHAASPTSPREGFVIAFEYDETVRVVMGLEQQLSDMRESLQLLHDIMLMGGFDCPELDQAKALLPTPPDTGEKP